ncbi:MAG TPA: hypothetical protein VFR47_31465 [Anaerolineales bacterium]|nr:hypothetical protein [Anaerolineales bacterium]
MIKFKRLAFMAVVTVAALLVLGNLTTPAQTRTFDALSQAAM